MSDAAKNRVIALGTQFNCAERSPDPLSVQFEGSSKKSFWKRNTSKLPGRLEVLDVTCNIVVCCS
jgi:hypothetical protein